MVLTLKDKSAPPNDDLTGHVIFSFPGTRMMVLTATKVKSNDDLTGHVIFNGSSGVLFYNYAGRSTTFIRWDSLSEIHGCNFEDEKCDREPPIRESDHIDLYVIGFHKFFDPTLSSGPVKAS